MDSQEITVPLESGARVTLLSDVSVEENAEGSTGTVLFEDYVERHVPETSLLEFEESDVGRVEFLSLLDEAESIEIIRNS